MLVIYLALGRGGCAESGHFDDFLPEAESSSCAAVALTGSNVNDIYIRSLTQAFPWGANRGSPP